MRIIVCGSRTFTDRLAINSVLNGLWWPDLTESQPNLLTVVEGGATGADSIAGEWADRTAGVRRETVHADWRKHGSMRAGPIRNREMLEHHGPIDLVIAFVNKPLERSKGTFDMVRCARGAGVPTWVVEVLPSLSARPRGTSTLFDS